MAAVSALGSVGVFFEKCIKPNSVFSFPYKNSTDKGSEKIATFTVILYFAMKC